MKFTNKQFQEIIQQFADDGLVIYDEKGKGVTITEKGANEVLKFREKNPELYVLLTISFSQIIIEDEIKTGKPASENAYFKT